MPDGQVYGWSTYEKEIKAAAERHKIPWSYLTALIQWESAFKPRIVGKAGDTGLGQIIPSDVLNPSSPYYWKTTGGFRVEPKWAASRPTMADLLDPATNIDYTAQILAGALTKHGGDPVEAYFGAGGYNPGANRGIYQQSFTNVINQWAQWENIQQFPEDIPEGGVTPPQPYPRKIDERRAEGEPIQDAPLYYEGYEADVERQEQLTALAYTNLEAAGVDLKQAQQTASFWNIFRPISVITGWRPPGVKREEPQYLIDWHSAQEKFRPVSEQYYLEQLKLHTYYHLPEGMMIGEVMSPQDAIDWIKDRATDALGEEAAMRAISPEYESFVADIFNKLSGTLRYTPGASCEDLVNALTSPTRPRPMAFGADTPTAEIIRRQRLPTVPEIAEMGTFQDMRDIYLACGLPFPEEMLSVKRSWEGRAQEAVEIMTAQEMMRDALLEPRIPSLTAWENLQLSVTQPGTALLEGYLWYYRKFNAPIAGFAWEKLNQYLGVQGGIPAHVEGGKPWKRTLVPGDVAFAKFEADKAEAISKGMSELEALGYAWEQFDMDRAAKFAWEIIFDPANLLAAVGGSIAGVVKGIALGAGYEKLGRVGVAAVQLVNAPNDILASPFLAGKAMWKRLPWTPHGMSVRAAREAFSEVDAFLVRSFPGKWPRMSADDTAKALMGAIDDYASAPYAANTLTQSQRAGRGLVQSSWRRIGRDETIEIAVKLGVPDPERAITQQTLDHINVLWNLLGVSEPGGFIKPREAAELLLETLGHRSSPTLMDIAENIWRAKQDVVVDQSKRLLRGRSANAMLRNWFQRVSDTVYKNWMDYDWRFSEGSEFLGRSLRVGDMISKIGIIQKMAGINRRFASWVLYFPNFGPMNWMETGFRAHRIGVGLGDAFFPSKQAFAELRTFAYLPNFPYEFRVGPPRLTGLLMGEPGESIIDDIARLDDIYRSRVFGRRVPFVTEPLKFPRDLVKKAPWLKHFNDLPEALKMLPGSPAWNDWWGYVGQLQRAESIMASFDRNLLEAAPDAMRAIDDLMPPVTRALDNIESLIPREREEIAHALWRSAQAGPESIRQMVRDPNWYRRARFAQDVMEAAEHFPHLERGIVDEFAGMAERGEFTSIGSIDDGADKIMRAWKQGWIQRLDDSADRIRMVCSQIAAARPENPDDLMAILRSMDTLVRIDLDVLSASKSAVTEAAHDVIQPAAKDAMHQTEYLTRLMHQRQVGRSTDYAFNLIESWIKGEAPPPIDWGTVQWIGFTAEEAEPIMAMLDLLPYELQSDITAIKLDPEALDLLAIRLDYPPSWTILGRHSTETGEVWLRKVPGPEDMGTFIHEIYGHGWLAVRAQAGDIPFYLDAIDALAGKGEFGIPQAELLRKRAAAGNLRQPWAEWRSFEEEFSDAINLYINAPDVLRAENPKAHMFFDAHLAPVPQIPLSEADKVRALSHIDYMREHQAIVYTTRDKISSAYSTSIQMYGRGKHWPAFLATEEKLWGAAKVDLADLYMRKGASLHLEAAKYDPLPRLAALTRPLTKGDLADALRVPADQVRPIDLDTYLLMSEEKFGAEVRAAAGAAGKAQGLSADVEEAADLLGFNKEEVGRVYRDLIRDMGIEPSVATALSPTERAVAALRDEVKMAYTHRMIPPEDVAKLNDAVEKLAIRAERVYPDNWLELQGSAMEKARMDFELEHVNITDANVFDAFMKGTFPFWTYESQRWPWLFHTFLRSPHIATNLGRYMNYTDRGYIHIPGTDLRWNPFGGTIFMSAFARLQMRDYPEYFDLPAPVSELTGALMRLGFYPGLIQTLPFVAWGAVDRNKRPQTAELLPAFGQSALNVFLTKFPDSHAAYILREIVFPDRFRDYYIMQMVDKLAFQRGLDIYGTRLWEKKEQGIELTIEETALWNESSAIVAKFGILSATTGWFTLRPEERKLAYEASAQMIEEFTGIPKDAQEEAMRHYAITGKRLSDVFPLDPFQAYMLREVEKINRFALSTYTSPLQPSGWQKQRVRTGQYWSEVETIWDHARHIGWPEEGIMSLDYLEQAFTIGVMEDGQLVAMNASDYRREVGRTLEYASSAVEQKAQSEYYKYDMTTHDGVPKTFEERADYYEQHGIPMPTYHPLQELLYSYYDLKPELRFDPDTGAMERDFDTFYAMTSALIESIPEEARGVFMDRLTAEWTPMRKLQWAVSRDLFQPYRAIREAIISQRSPEEQDIINRYARATELEKDALRAEVDAQGLKIIAQFESDLSTARRNIRLATPELDAWLLFWGYTSTTLTPTAAQIHLDLLKKYRPIAIPEVVE